MKIQQNISLMEKLTILSDAAKYDVACTSSGVDRSGDGIGLGNSISLWDLSYFFRRWAVCFPSQDFIYKRMYF